MGERAERRYKENLSKGNRNRFKAKEEIAARDYKDSHRETSPPQASWMQSIEYDWPLYF